MACTIRRNISAYILLPALLLTVLMPLPALAAQAGSGKAFATPEQGVEALVAAVRKGDRNEVMAVMGPGSREIVSSGDEVIDRESRQRFLMLYDDRNAIERPKAGKAVLVVGTQDYPFPVPLVKRGGRWYFDAKAGREEILNRRIGRNELEVIDVLNAYVEAQREYASQDRGSGLVEFAQKIRSTPGKKDGLYWEAKEGEEESPLGPLAAQAAREGYLKGEKGEPTPFHGYYFKILKAQGKNAPGGAYDYVVNGRMVLGFAMIAYPARYGSSGIMTFVVNQNGVVYQKDLGKGTAGTAAAIKRFDPDRSWKKVDQPPVTGRAESAEK